MTLAPQQITETSVAVARGRATLHGRTSDFELYAGDSVLDAVQRVRPDAPFSCRSGVCSTCQAILREGDVTMAVNYGLTDDEVARGYVLTCQSQPDVKRDRDRLRRLTLRERLGYPGSQSDERPVKTGSSPAPETDRLSAVVAAASRNASELAATAA